MQGQAHNMVDLGAPHLALGDLGNDLVAQFYRWKALAEENDGALTFFDKWDGKALKLKAAATNNKMSQHASFSVVNDRDRGCIDKILRKNISPKIKCKVRIL